MNIVSAFDSLAFDAAARPRGAEDVRAVLAALTAEEAAQLELAARYDWRLWARPKQLEPAAKWRWWVLLSGRGFG